MRKEEWKGGRGGEERRRWLVSNARVDLFILFSYTLNKHLRAFARQALY